MEVNSKDMTMVFNNLGIQCVKKRGVEEALSVREFIRVDPFRSELENSEFLKYFLILFQHQF